MPTLELSVDELITTTRAVRKRLDFERSVEMAVIDECLELALQAPSGSNTQGWRFVVVAEDDKRRQVGDFYWQAFTAYRDMPVSVHARAKAEQDGGRAAQMERVVSSAEHLAENMGRAPLLLIPCIEGRCDATSGGAANLLQAGLF